MVPAARVEKAFASVRVDLEALETMAGALSPGSADEAAKGAARAAGRRRFCCVASAARPAEGPGLEAPPPLSEKLRTRDSCIAKRRGKVHVGGGATWGAAAAFRFALPDEALPPQNSAAVADARAADRRSSASTAARSTL